MAANAHAITKPLLIAYEEDPATLRQIVQAAEPWWEVHGLRDSGKVLYALEHDPSIRVLIATQNIGTMTGAMILEAARRMRPDVRRILLTAYNDLPTLIDGLHSGAIQYLVQTPCQRSELLAAIQPEAGPVPVVTGR